MLVYPSGFDMSSSALRFLSAQLRRRRRELGSRWRRLSPGRQALLTLAHLRNGHPYAQLAAGFGIGTTTKAKKRGVNVQVLAGHPGRAGHVGAGRVDEQTKPPMEMVLLGRNPIHQGLHLPASPTNHPGSQVGTMASLPR